MGDRAVETHCDSLPGQGQASAQSGVFCNQMPCGRTGNRLPARRRDRCVMRNAANEDEQYRLAFRLCRGGSVEDAAKINFVCCHGRSPHARKLTPGYDSPASPGLPGSVSRHRCGGWCQSPGGWETARVVLVVDDLVDWLVGKLADAGYQRVSTRLFGSEQDRALKQAVMAAVQSTAAEASPSGQQAGQLAERIGDAFGKRVPVRLPQGQLSRLDALRAGVAAQLAVSGDADGALLGLSVDMVADRLTAHLLFEISARGSAGGPLAPLANQLDHDLTHSQLREIKERLIQRVPFSSAGYSPGRPLSEVRDPGQVVTGDVPQPPLAFQPRADLLAELRAAGSGVSVVRAVTGMRGVGKTPEVPPVFRTADPLGSSAERTGDNVEGIPEILTGIP